MHFEASAASLFAEASKAESGGRGIRTPGPREGSTVFKTAAIDRSAIPPGAKIERDSG